ncbi:MAG: sulfurtransferase TusA family protein [Gammaproteobacteria bacterium]|uniref:sulfurtransferase TusA family protein n=1 Tax=Pseudomaricurvus alcaniphilus TaxID=1166482 RepID=UPI00140A31EC|nr:sulfurtransferase TusA family protein [Pseudomaricurvus alcaniphilus]MBR9912825.1 sulfurtransferase TusA family protein [Gammaproteobacteria bacterium]NHN37804.1 sulfurtransferase TusA family protein [Pseudomaricurvus alcaniphilus]
MQELDARGLQCPLPLLKAKQALNQLSAGERLRVMATDPGSRRDFATFARLSGHELLQSTVVDGVYLYVLQKV